MFMENISESINKVIKQISEKQKDKSTQILDKWDSFAGKLLARHSSPVDLRNKTLVVNVENSAWMYMLRLKQAQILGNINKALAGGDIQDIKLRVGKISS